MQYLVEEGQTGLPFDSRMTVLESDLQSTKRQEYFWITWSGPNPFEPVKPGPNAAGCLRSFSQVHYQSVVVFAVSSSSYRGVNLEHTLPLGWPT